MFSLLIGLALADTVSVDVPPSAVTVYAERARVTRTASIQLARGVHEIQFSDLPTSASLDSLTADVTGGSELLGIQTRIVPASEVADDRVATLQERLLDLQDARLDRVDDRDAAQARLASVARARTASSTQLSAQLLVVEGGAATARALQTQLSAEDAAARTAIRQANQAIRALDEQIAAAQREQSSLGSTATDTVEAVVRIEVTRAGRIDVDLTYTVGGASWTPRYDLRGNASTGTVELALSAVISQRTGEDWEDVALKVSSARPGRGTDVPTLDPFWLQTYRPARPMMERAMEDVPSSGGRAMAAAPAPPPPAPMEQAQAVVQTQLAATTFSVDAAETLPSDGSARKVLLTTVDLDSDLRHVSVPRIDPTAYLIGEVTNTAEFPLLPGPAGVFVDGAYVGDIRLDTVPTGETFDVSFGPDDAVTVQRTRGETTTGASGPVGRRQSAEWQWALEVRSQHARPITVELREQVPVSPREDVEVEWEVEQGEPSVEAEDGGVLAMTVQVPARGREQIVWEYTVTYPGDLTLGWME